MMKTVLQIIGAVALAGVLVYGSIFAAHLWQDHQNYHTNTQLLELIRQAVVDSHPELLEESNEEQ